MNRLRIALASAGCVFAFCAAQVEPRATKPLPLKVIGTQLQNSAGAPVRLRGVNTASMEWTSDGEGHILETVMIALRDWHANVIRLPLSQDRWFGKAPEQTDKGKYYRILVRQVVDAVSRRAATLSWTCTGRTRAIGGKISVSTSCRMKTA